MVFIRSASAFFALVMLACFSAAGAAQRYRVGQITTGEHVLADPTAMHHWIACTVTAVNPAITDPGEINNVTILCHGTTFVAIADADHLRPGGSGGAVSSSVSSARNVAAHAATSRAASSTRVAAATGAPPATLSGGKYHCKIGYGVAMLTYGDFILSGNSYTFIPANGVASQGGRGTFHINADRSITWTGDVGVINRPPAHVVRSRLDGVVKNTFAFEYQPLPGMLTQFDSCRKL